MRQKSIFQVHCSTDWVPSVEFNGIWQTNVNYFCVKTFKNCQSTANWQTFQVKSATILHCLIFKWQNNQWADSIFSNSCIRIITSYHYCHRKCRVWTKNGWKIGQFQKFQTFKCNIKFTVIEIFAFDVIITSINLDIATMLTENVNCTQYMLHTLYVLTPHTEKMHQRRADNERMATN